MRDDEVRVRIMIIALAIVAALVTDGARADGPAADPQRTPSVKPVTSAPHPTAKAVPVRGRLPETPNNPPAPAEVLSRRATEPARTWARGPFVSVQVNVNAMGNNIIGDAANEPSIAIDPTDPSKIAIGWRQFDTIASDFRQAGVAYSQDDGQTWTFPGVLDPGQFRSDPVLGADADGNFYYYSLSTVTTAEVFKSTDGGATWAAPVNGWGGDKEWMTVDRTSSIGQNNIYAIWNVQFSCCGNTDFTRSINQGLSFQSPIKVPEPSMKWGTLDVGPDGTLYLAGATLDQSGHVFARSVNAKNTAQTPVFDLVTSISLGGTTSFGNPNPDGLLGQVNIATDHSAGPSSGNVYVLASVNPPNADPLDVMFIRSTDGGATWSTPVRVNDDALGAWQWFGTMSVAPNGRIDVVWNDTRNTGADNLSELFYAYSLDAGTTWSTNIAVSPVFNSHLGWPQQNKMGDYFHMISDNGGANLAYAATFNGEQDVYFIRILRDCNGNGIDDTIDIADETSEDCNDNDIPDECEPDEDCNENTVQDICDIAAGSDDCNFNQVPDECEPDEDCNNNGIRDICEIGDGSAPDCNDNGIPDECDIAAATSSDDNGNGVPDECEGACCLCAGCVDTTPQDCAGQLGTFAGLGILCQDYTCQGTDNDECANAQLLPSVSQQTIEFNNTCATNDGPTPVSCDNGSQPFGADIWFQYRPACDTTMTVSLCDGTGYDAIMAVYGGQTNCTCPFEGSPQLACSDDSCGVGGGPPTVSMSVLANRCYTIRIAGWNASVGFGEMVVSAPCCTASTEPAPDDPEAKNRYLSFTAGDPGESQAVQVTFASLPGYEGAEGRTAWVQQPTAVTEAPGASGPSPSPTFWAAQLGCAPYYTDWSAFDRVDVSDDGILPDGTYEVRVISNACALADPGNYSTPLVATMSAVGDVVGDCSDCPCTGPDGVVDFIDISAVVEKFKDTECTPGGPGVPRKARADLINTTTELPKPDRVIDFVDIAYTVDAFQSEAAPLPGPPGTDPCPGP